MLVIIPVLNEAASIAGVICTLQQTGLSQIRVVDNGSTDDSIAEAEQAGAEVLVEPIAGYGRACWRGLQQIPAQIEWILFCDGDGSDDLSELPQFFAAMARADFILGDRRATAAGRAAMTPAQNFGNWLAPALIRLGWGYRYHDLGPLRLIRRSTMEAMQMRDRSFGWTVEMQARAVEMGLRIEEIPVGYRQRQGGRSKISGTLKGSIKAGTVILSTLGWLYGKRLQMQIRQHLTQFGQQFSLRSSQNSLLWFSAALILVGCLWMQPHGDFLQLGTVEQFWIGSILMGIGFLLSGKVTGINGRWFWGVAVIARLILLFMYPGDDIWRYRWEGHIQNLGFSPYQLPPMAAELEPYRTSWWELINTTDTSAIYPPVAQFGFRILAAITPSVLLFKSAFVAADLAICVLLSHRFGYQKTLIYAWNPLVLYSFAGGGHYDSWFLLPLVAAWMFSSQKKWSWPSVLIGLSIAIKWVSLPILGFWAWLQLPRFRVAIAVGFLGLLPFVLSAAPFCNLENCYLIPVNSNFVTRGHSAELFPYLLRQVFPQVPDRNYIYAIPLVLVLLGLLTWDFWQHSISRFGLQLKSDLSTRFLHLSQAYFTALLVLSPIVHAWYFTWLVPFAVATQNLGVRWVSVSAFIYFELQRDNALENYSWQLSPVERTILWSPFVLGTLWTILRSRKVSRLDNTSPVE
ncbi:MAG: glycosyltransferase [Microcoleaceae cyanobacterium]